MRPPCTRTPGLAVRAFLGLGIGGAAAADGVMRGRELGRGVCARSCRRAAARRLTSRPPPRAAPEMGAWAGVTLLPLATAFLSPR